MGFSTLLIAKSQHIETAHRARGKIGQVFRFALQDVRAIVDPTITLRLAPLLFVRPGELRTAEWKDFDLDAAEWRYIASKIKMGNHLLVALAAQAVDALRELQVLIGKRPLAHKASGRSREPMTGCSSVPRRTPEDDAGTGGLPGRPARESQGGREQLRARCLTMRNHLPTVSHGDTSRR